MHWWMSAAMVLALWGGSVVGQEVAPVEFLEATDRVVTRGAPDRALVIEGQPAATIWLSGEAPERERQAAAELQRYVQEASGAILPVEIRRRPPRGYVVRITHQPAQLDPEGFTIRVEAGETLIEGRSALGALYGTYELIERALGVRWYVPDDPLGTVVPRQNSIILPELDESQAPSFPMRWVGTQDLGWTLRNRQNRCTDGFWIYPAIYHTQERWLPHQEYSGEHPEYFALIGGERSQDRACKLCYSNPDVARQIARNMVAALDENPGIDLLSFSPTDGQMWCECDGCRAMDEEDVPRDQSKSRRSMLFYNAIAAALHATHPDARLLVGAYNVYNWPPKDPNIKADPMLAVVITHYEDYCMAHPVPDPECPRNARYVELVDAWQALGCDVYYYEYYTKGNWNALPWPIVHCLQKDIPWYRDRGHKGVYTQFTTAQAWTLYPAYYVAARLLWDAGANADALLDEMCDGLFGAAGPAMREYYRVQEEAMGGLDRHFPGHGTTASLWLFTEDVLAKMGDALRRAHEAETDELVGQRLAKIDLSYEYTRRLMEYSRARASIDEQKPPGEALAAAEKALGLYDALVDEVVGDPQKWAGVVPGKSALQRPSIRSEVDRLKARIRQLREKSPPP